MVGKHEVAPSSSPLNGEYTGNMNTSSSKSPPPNHWIDFGPKHWGYSVWSEHIPQAFSLRSSLLDGDAKDSL